MCHILCHIEPMPSVILRQLRNTPLLMKWIEAGEIVELKKRDRVVARIVPESRRPGPVEWPDFEARAKEIFGDRVLTAVDDLIKDREESRY